MARIDFWFSIGSTYSYLSVMRLGRVAIESGIEFAWRPFNVRTIMVAQNNIPFANKPVKAAYMWRDIARRAQKYGLAPRLPAPYPIADLPLANQVALLGMREGWGIAYLTETYRLWFEEGEVAGAETNLSRAVETAGQNPADVLALASGDAAVAALAEETERVMGLGIFGSPSFVVDGEVFWGDDRLDDAISWAREGRVL
jgi:2-hydroxychromene-2-carboxylate isomerase